MVIFFIHADLNFHDVMRKIEHVSSIERLVDQIHAHLQYNNAPRLYLKKKIWD